MNCPACSKQLTEKNVADVRLDICDNGCGGIWFDNHEFKKFDEAIEPDAETLLAITINIQGHLDREKPHNCPRCKTIVMRRFYSSVQKKIQMDECGKCGGTWLDAGEITAIRNEYKTEAERKAAAAKLYSDTFDGPLQMAKQKAGEDKKTAQRIANAFKFVCPTYFIPGKQKWGAF